MAKAKKSTINYSWVVNALDARVEHDKNSNVIYNIHWGYYADQSDNSVSMIGTMGVEYDKDNFIEYDELQKSDVIEWLEAKLDVDSMKADLSDQLSVLANPTDVVLRPNW
tara:strand:+ start:189 stop:518 length:330 start_codon:yes stop_codon:yes gene_type:complete